MLRPRGRRQHWSAGGFPGSDRFDNSRCSKGYWMTGRTSHRSGSGRTCRRRRPCRGHHRCRRPWLWCPVDRRRSDSSHLGSSAHCRRTARRHRPGRRRRRRTCHHLDRRPVACCPAGTGRCRRSTAGGQRRRGIDAPRTTGRYRRPCRSSDRDRRRRWWSLAGRCRSGSSRWRRYRRHSPRNRCHSGMSGPMDRPCRGR